MDIETLYTVEAHEQGAEMQVKGPDGILTDIYIRLIGVDSKTWRGMVKRKERAMMKMSFDEISDTDDAYTLIAEATIGWRGMESGGEPVEFSREKAEQLYQNAPYILDQADKFIATRANFMKG